MSVRGSLGWDYQSDKRYAKTTGAAMSAHVAVVATLEYERDVAIPGGLESGANRVAAALEEWAKVNHPWTNRTGLAEQQLTGFVEETNGGFIAGLGHGVDYGFYLERDPRWSVLDKAQQAIFHQAPAIMADEVALELRGVGSKFRHKASGRFVSNS